MVQAATSAGVGPMFTFEGRSSTRWGASSESMHELTVACDGDYHIRSRKRMKLGVKRRGGETHHGGAAPSQSGWGSPRRSAAAAEEGPDGLAVIADTCMLADAAAAGVQAVLGKPGGFHRSLQYLRQVPGVHGA